MNAPNQKLTRQQLYQRIKEAGGKDAYILSEMKRLGFWPEDSDQPTLTEAFISQRTKLQQELHDLVQQLDNNDDPATLLVSLHKTRKKEALARREANRQAANQARFEKKRAWHQHQQQEIGYLGEAVSHGLRHKESDTERLQAQNLPVFENVSALAQAMGISVQELRFLSYKKPVSQQSHYRRFAIEKKSGGLRCISAPMPRLKRAQYWILDNLLKPVAVSDSAHGFIAQRSIVSNAEPHIAKDLVINIDLQDFFPTITFKRVKGVFRQLGYSEQLSVILAALCTEAQTEQVELDGETFFVATSGERLPQGTPTSPAISNLLCRKLDQRLQGVASKLQFAYSRYADDLSFSANQVDDKTLNQLLWRVRQVIKDEGFVIHPNKTHIMRRHKQQQVTGIVVNQKPSIDRKTLKKFRAVLFQIEKDGPDGKSWGRGELFSAIKGYADFVAMVDKEKGAKLQQKVAELRAKYQQPLTLAPLKPLNKKHFRQQAAQGKPPRADWWQPTPPPEPTLELTPQQIALAKKAKADKEKAEKKRAKGTGASVQNSSRARSGDDWQDEPVSGGFAHLAARVMVFVAVGILVWLVVWG